MESINTGPADQKRRSTWEPPTVKKVAIGAGTKSAPAGQPSARVAEPALPSPPASKLGFSFEMAFPLSARTEHQG